MTLRSSPTPLLAATVLLLAGVAHAHDPSLHEPAAPTSA